MIENRTIEIGLLDPHPANYNQHPARQVERLRVSLRKFGQPRSIVVQAQASGRFVIVAGHGVTLAARAERWTGLRCDVIPADWPAERVLAYLAADNELGRGAEPDNAALASILEEAKRFDPELLTAIGYDEAEFEALLREVGGGDEPAEDPGPQTDRAEELREKWQVEAGQMWQLGEHRLICGDCTDPAVVARLMGGERAVLCHADPPYGMGKEAEGIANDNLYRENLDAFQMQWWKACRPSIEDNGSAYIWGNAEALWRLWYVGGLKDSERLTFRSQVIWDKPPSASSYGSPIGSEKMRSYPHGYEVCFFFMLGEQGFNNNADNYWDGWEGIRSTLAADCEKMGWTAEDVKRITGVGMYGHWFTKSQWTFIPEEHYKKLQAAAREHDAFKREHDELKREHDELKREHDELKRDFYETRAYFDNTHDNMTDVWSFDRVTGDDRHGHATPKPVAMMARAIKSSSPDGAIVYAPFNGTGPELIACEQLGRRCRAVEISPGYVAVALQRWADMTGGTPSLCDA